MATVQHTPRTSAGTRHSALDTKRALVRRIIRALEKLFPDAGQGTMLRYSNHWELLVAVELSAQCTDKKVNEVTGTLFKKYRSLDDYVRVSASRRTVLEFERDIRPTGFFRNKAKNILAAAKMVKEKFHGRLPKTMAEMLTIPGVGRKTANVVLGNAHGVVLGIAVDTHVRRLARRLGLSRENDPEKIERDLMQIVPKKDWFRFTYLLIEYGRKYCPSRPHDHAHCPLSKIVPDAHRG
jgi:endonuclease III